MTDVGRQSKISDSGWVHRSKALLSSPPSLFQPACESSVPLSHFGSGTRVSLFGPASDPGRHWLRYLCPTNSTDLSHHLIFTWPQPSQGGSGHAGGAFGITTSLRVSAKLAAVSSALLAAVLVAYNNLINLWPPFQRLYVRFNACVAAAVTGLALGPLKLEPLAVGLKGNTLLEAGAGAAAGVILTCPLYLALASPCWAKLIADRRLDDVDVRELLQRIFYRVPWERLCSKSWLSEACCWPAPRPRSRGGCRDFERGLRLVACRSYV
jgi:hypothetical protein